MAIPGYQEFMLPLLKFAADGQEHTISEALATLAEQMGISEAEQDLMLPSGTQSRFYNRVSWAVTYLTKSLLLEKAGRGKFKIAQRGREVLSRNPAGIDSTFLEQFPEYQAFKTKKNKAEVIVASGDEQGESAADSDITPEERLGAAYEELREALADDLL